MRTFESVFVDIVGGELLGNLASPLATNGSFDCTEFDLSFSVVSASIVEDIQMSLPRIVLSNSSGIVLYSMALPSLSGHPI